MRLRLLYLCLCAWPPCCRSVVGVVIFLDLSGSGRAREVRHASVLQGSRSQGTRWKASCQLVSMLGFFTTLICYEGPAFRASPCWLAALRGGAFEAVGSWLSRGVSCSTCGFAALRAASCVSCVHRFCFVGSCSHLGKDPIVVKLSPLHVGEWQGLFGVEGLLAASGFTQIWLHLFYRVEKAPLWLRQRCYANLFAPRVFADA